MASQFASIRFQTIGILFPGFWMILLPCRLCKFGKESDTLPYEVVRVSWRHIVSLFVLGSVKGILLYRLPSEHIWSIEAGQ